MLELIRMPHVAHVAMSGFRVREREMLALGMTLPGLQPRAAALAGLPSLGLLTIAALTPAHWTQSYHEAATVDDTLVAAVLATRPAVAAVSALTASILEAYGLAARLRAEGVRVVIGGIHATACPSEVASHADAVVVGDGEPVWAGLLADAESGRLRPLYRADRPFDLAMSPLPRYDLIGSRSRPRFTLQTERGCPLACEFCGASRLLGPFREKPIDRIEAELAQLRTLSQRPIVELADDNTFAGRRDASELLEALGGAGIRYFTEADWRLGERPEVVDRLAPSGCIQVLVGLERLHRRYPGMGGKRAELERMMAAVDAIQNRGVAVIGCFVVGGDGEDMESMHELGEFLLRAPFADVQLTLQTPFPGTALHDRLSREGRLLRDRDWSSYTLFDATYTPDRLSVAQLENGFRNLVRIAFSAEPAATRIETRKRIWQRRGEAAA
jgi:radical SAM superfamily enzyme YgiQ (UPF0313 family)